MSKVTATVSETAMEAALRTAGFAPTEETEAKAEVVKKTAVQKRQATLLAKAEAARANLIHDLVGAAMTEAKAEFDAKAKEVQAEADLRLKHETIRATVLDIDKRFMVEIANLREPGGALYDMQLEIDSLDAKLRRQVTKTGITIPGAHPESHIIARRNELRDMISATERQLLDKRPDVKMQEAGTQEDIAAAFAFHKSELLANGQKEN